MRTEYGRRRSENDEYEKTAYETFGRSFCSSKRTRLEQFTHDGGDDCLVGNGRNVGEYTSAFNASAVYKYVLGGGGGEWRVRGVDDGREIANRAKRTGTINVAWYTASLEPGALEQTATRRGVRSSCSCPAVPFSYKTHRARPRNFDADVNYFNQSLSAFSDDRDRSGLSTKPILLGPDRRRRRIVITRPTRIVALSDVVLLTTVVDNFCRL